MGCLWVQPALNRLQWVEICIDDCRVRPDCDTIANRDTLCSADRATGHAEIIADLQHCTGLPGAEYDRMVGSQRVRAVPSSAAASCPQRPCGCDGASE